MSRYDIRQQDHNSFVVWDNKLRQSLGNGKDAVLVLESRDEALSVVHTMTERVAA